MHKRILVIRLGALGDLVQCFQAFHEIREKHKEAEIALLTMPAFVDFARAMPWFDRIIIDPRPPAWRVDQWLKLVTAIKSFAPQRVYDLQGKKRQSVLFALLGGPMGPEWSGAAPMCSHPRFDPPQKGMHYKEFVARQLRLADVPPQPPAGVSWLDAPMDGFTLPERFAVLVPGCAPHREYKRWPPQNYTALAQKLQAEGIASIAIGTKQDAAAIASIRMLAAEVIDFSGRTNLMQLAGLMRRAACVVANDTGPAHIAAAVGAAVLTLISDRVDAPWVAPRGAHAQWLLGTPLAELDVEKVFLALREFLAQKNGSSR